MRVEGRPLLLMRPRQARLRPSGSLDSVGRPGLKGLEIAAVGTVVRGENVPYLPCGMNLYESCVSN